MEQNDTTPTSEQLDIIIRAGLNPDNWTVVKDYKYIMIINNRQTKETRRIGK